MPATRASARSAGAKGKGKAVKAEESKNEIHRDSQRGSNNDRVASYRKRSHPLSRKNLGATLRAMEDEISERELQAKRGCWPEIKRRLKKMGWTKEDMPFGWDADGKVWHELVSQPRPLTEQIWADIRPKLVQILERRRADRLQEERDQRQDQRKSRLYELLRDIRKKHSLVLRPEKYDSLSRHSAEVAKPRFTIRGPFPTLERIIDWPLVKNIYQSDITSEEMEGIFEENREAIESLIAKWRNQIQSHLAGLLRDGYESKGEVIRPTLAVCTKDTGALASVSDDLKILLRADTFFYKTSDPSKRPFSYGTLLSSEGLDPQLCLFDSEASPNLDHIRWYPEAHEAAQEILASLGKPDMTYLNRDFFGKLVCGRCHDTLHRNWQKMVQHYVEQKLLHAKIHEDESYLSDNGIAYNNTHDPAAPTDWPMVMEYFRKVVGIGIDTRIGPLQMCRLCERIPAAEHVIAPMKRILKHLRDVHGITEPQADEHYLPRTIFDNDSYEMKDYDSGDSYRTVYGHSSRYYMSYSENEEEDDSEEQWGTDDGCMSSTDEDSRW